MAFRLSVSEAFRTRRSASGHGRNGQGYQSGDDLLDARVDQGHVELGLGGQLLPGHREPALDDVGRLGARGR